MAAVRCWRSCASADSASSTTPCCRWPRADRRHRRDRRRQDDGRHRPAAALRRPGRRGAGPRRRRAGRRRGPARLSTAATAVRATGGRGRRRARRRHRAGAAPHGHRRGPLARARRRPSCRWRCSASSASSWSPCTASPTSCGCSARPSSGPRWTGSPAVGRCADVPRARTTGGAPARRELAERPQRAGERAGRPTCCATASTRSSRVDPQPGEDDELTRRGAALEHAEGLRARRAGRRTRAVGGAGRPPRGAPTCDRCSGSARRALEAQAGADPALGELAGRLEEVGHAGRRPRRRARRLPGDAGRRPGPARAGRGAAGRAAALTRKYAGADVDGVLAWAEHGREPGSPSWTCPTRCSRAAPASASGGARGRRGRRPGCSARPGEAAGRLAAASPSSWPGWRCRRAAEVEVRPRRGHRRRRRCRDRRQPRCGRAGRRRRGRAACSRRHRARRRCRWRRAPPAASCPG